jgi:hypothetical protein
VQNQDALFGKGGISVVWMGIGSVRVVGHVAAC